tara:strand:- start:18677 stop:19324 length:648 start_codon:yes stop_codon:yes gene_type:complete
MKSSTLVLSLFLLLIIGCKKENQKKVQATDTITTVETDTIIDTDSTTKEYEPTDNDIREFGIMENAEDGGYPFFVVTMNFVERNIKHDFNLNIEAISLTNEELDKLKGKYATIYYTSEDENDLSDLHFKGKSLFGEYAPEMDTNWKKTTGVMTGADRLSGDLPGKVTVTDADGKKTTFEVFIDDETMKANGKTVTAYYTIKGVDKITHIEPSSEE